VRNLGKEKSYAFTGSGFTVQGYLSLAHFQQYYAWMNLLHPEFGAFYFAVKY